MWFLENLWKDENSLKEIAVELERSFKDACKIINLQMEYSQYRDTPKWAQMCTTTTSMLCTFR